MGSTQSADGADGLPQDGGASAGSSGSARSSGSSSGSRCQVQVAATEIFRLAGVCAYHTSVILGGREYYFDSEGIVTAPALWSHQGGRLRRSQHGPTEVISLGSTKQTGAALTQALRPFFAKGSYDMLHKNCNSFTDAAAYFLSRSRLDGRFTRLERLLRAAEPLSTSVLNGLYKAASPRGFESPAPYVTNPLAQGFSVEEIIDLWRTVDDPEEAPHSRAVGDSRGLALLGCSFEQACCRASHTRPLAVPRA